MLALWPADATPAWQAGSLRWKSFISRRVDLLLEHERQLNDPSLNELQCQEGIKTGTLQQEASLRNVASGLLGALLAQPLSAQELEAFTAIKELEAFAPTTIVRVNVNAVVGALRYDGSAVDQGANWGPPPASTRPWALAATRPPAWGCGVGSCALPCGFEGAFEAGLDRRDKVKYLCWLLALCPFASKRNEP
jgi:hypothetical protein